MDPLMFALEMSRTWAVPMAFVVCIALLRKPLSELLPTLAKLKYKDQQREFQAAFDKRLANAEAQADKAQLPPAELPPALPPARVTVGPVSALAEQIADFSPDAAVLFAWQQLETSARDALARSGDPDAYRGRLDIKLDQRRLLPIDAIHLLDELSILRNQVAQSKDLELTRAQALEFARLVDRMIVALQLPDDAVALGAISHRTGGPSAADQPLRTSPLSSAYAPREKRQEKPL